MQSGIEQQGYSQELLEKLIPAVRNPIDEVNLAMLVKGVDVRTKAMLKLELQRCWSPCSEPIDHRKISQEVHTVEYNKLTHYIAPTALKEFKRLQKLYRNCYTLGLKRAVDLLIKKQLVSKSQIVEVGPWSLQSSDLGDFRRKSERLLLVSQVMVQVVNSSISFQAKTSNISTGGCLLVTSDEQAAALTTNQQIIVDFIDIGKKFTLRFTQVSYQLVSVSQSKDVFKLALKASQDSVTPQFEQVITSLIREFKRRNRLDVNNTVCSAVTRGHNLASISQLNGLMVMSHRQDIYHLLISQGQTLSLQAELLMNQYLIARLVELTPISENAFYFLWAPSQTQVFMAPLKDLKDQQRYDECFRVWNDSPWHKLIMVTAEGITNEQVNLGTSLPAKVSSIADKLNQPLPPKIAKFSDELAKVSLIDDVTHLALDTTNNHTISQECRSKLMHFELTESRGVLRQVPFNIKEIHKFHDTYRFSHDCELSFGKHSYKIINGYANNREAMVSLFIDSDRLVKGMKVHITWLIDDVHVRLSARIVEYFRQYKRVSLTFCEHPNAIKLLFSDLNSLDAFEPAFIEDVQVDKLDVAVRNLLLSNLPKFSLLVQITQNYISLNAITGGQFLPPIFIGPQQSINLQKLFNQQIITSLAKRQDRYKDLLIVKLIDGRVEEQCLSSDFSHKKQLDEQVLLLLAGKGDVYFFAVDVSRTKNCPDDEILAIENKYLRYYNPARAKQVIDYLAFDLAIQLWDITSCFKKMMGFTIKKKEW